MGCTHVCAADGHGWGVLVFVLLVDIDGVICAAGDMDGCTHVCAADGHGWGILMSVLLMDIDGVICAAGDMDGVYLCRCR